MRGEGERGAWEGSSHSLGQAEFATSWDLATLPGEVCWNDSDVHVHLDLGFNRDAAREEALQRRMLKRAAQLDHVRKCDL